MSAFKATAPALALVLNALVWGLSWWPFRLLHGVGLHPLWATALVFCLAVAGVLAARPRAVAEVLRTPGLWLLMLGSGLTNAAFNWGVTVGDVVRVVLLFYLMPLWAVLLARVLLHERIGMSAVLRVLLALAGAALVLWPRDGAAFGAGLGLGDVLGLAGGFAFALNNVMLRREAGRSPAARALAMFSGGAAVSLLLALALQPAGVPLPPAAAPGWLLVLAALAVAFVLSNLALQYGAARLPASATAVIMLTEVLFASASAAVLGAATLTAATLAGGALIVAAAALAGWKAP